MAYDPKTYQAPAWAQNLQGFERKDARIAAADETMLNSVFMNSPFAQYLPKTQHGEYMMGAGGEGMGFDSSLIPEGYQVAWNKKDNYGRAALLDDKGTPVGSWEGAARDSLTHDDYATMAMIASAFAAGPLAGALGGGVAGAAGSGAILGGANGAISSNGDWKAALQGAAVGGLGGAAMGAMGGAAADPYGAGSGWGQDTLTNMGVGAQGIEPMGAFPQVYESTATLDPTANVNSTAPIDRLPAWEPPNMSLPEPTYYMGPDGPQLTYSPSDAVRAVQPYDVGAIDTVNISAPRLQNQMQGMEAPTMPEVYDPKATLDPLAPKGVDMPVREIAGGAGAGGLLSSLGDAVDSIGGMKSVLPVLGAIAGSQGTPGATSTTQQIMDPRMQELLYGSGGLLGSAKDLYAANKSGVNANMQAGWDRQLSLLNDPGVASQLSAMRDRGGLLSGGAVASNPFATGASIPRNPFRRG